jgi:aldose 1-epimerase
MPPSIRVTPFGRYEDHDIERFVLTNSRGMEVHIITFGGIITSLMCPDSQGEMADIVLGYDNLGDYLTDSSYLGAIIGRYGNRIAKGLFSLDGEVYQLPLNDGPHHLHGGPAGFHRVVWAARAFESDVESGVRLYHRSPSGHEGYPGTLDVSVLYRLTDAGDLICEYEATTDQATPVNLTQHSYFNLAGHTAGDVLGQAMQIKAAQFLPVDETLIPIGEPADVTGTPFDFREEKAIGRDIEQDAVQLQRGSGFDHTFVLAPADAAADGLIPAARMRDPVSGRMMEVLTTEPGMQLYTGNHLRGVRGKAGALYNPHSGFCLETQHFPDSPNQPHFPSTILRPGEVYRSRTVYRFGAPR